MLCPWQLLSASAGSCFLPVFFSIFLTLNFLLLLPLPDLLELPAGHHLGQHVAVAGLTQQLLLLAVPVLDLLVELLVVVGTSITALHGNFGLLGIDNCFEGLFQPSWHRDIVEFISMSPRGYC